MWITRQGKNRIDKYTSKKEKLRIGYKELPRRRTPLGRCKWIIRHASMNRRDIPVHYA